MSRFLPLFPLNLVVFPNEKLNLHIFEPRYKQLITECHANDTTFGIPVFLEKDLGDYGTEVKILSLENLYSGGEMDIKTQGIGIFKIQKFHRQMPGRLYAGGEVVDLILDAAEDAAVKMQVTQLLKQLYTALGLQTLMLNLPNNFISYDVAHHLGFSTEQEYELLQCLQEAERMAMILKHLTQILPIVLETERLKERVKLNGHFKNLPPSNF